jgi:serine protease Do
MLRRAVFVLLLVGGGLVAGLVLSGGTRSATDGDAEPPPRTAPAADAAAPAAPPAPAQSGEAASPPAPQGFAGLVGLPDLSGVAAEAIRGVVNISSTQVVQQRIQSPFEQDPFFRQFFGGSDERFGARTRQHTSLGSGVIVSSDGYIVTNNHVVGQNVTAVTVSFGDRREVPATIVGLDATTDLALLKVEETNLPTVSWGDSAGLKVGQWVLAIGSPFQLSQTVTLGIVSALGRANMGFADYENFIQTDAAINPGNSGGALVDVRGQLVGINTGILSQSGGYQGVGFAVPSELVRHVIDDLIEYGEVRRGSFGYIEVQPVPPRLAAQMRLPDTAGAWVTRINRASQAYQAGMLPDDVIVAFNGESLQDPSHLVRLVADAPIGSTSRVTVAREGREMELRIPIVAQSDAR